MPQFIPPTGNSFLDAYFGRRSELERLRSEEADRALREKLGLSEQAIQQQNVDVNKSRALEEVRSNTARELYQKNVEADRVAQQGRENYMKGLGLIGSGQAVTTPPPSMNVDEQGNISQLPNANMPAMRDLIPGMSLFPTTPEQQAERAGKLEYAKRQTDLRTAMQENLYKIDVAEKITGQPFPSDMKAMAIAGIDPKKFEIGTDQFIGSHAQRLDQEGKHNEAVKLIFDWEKQKAQARLAGVYTPAYIANNSLQATISKVVGGKVRDIVARNPKAATDKQALLRTVAGLVAIDPELDDTTRGMVMRELTNKEKDPNAATEMLNTMLGRNAQ